MQQKLFQFFLPQEAGVFGNDIEKERQKPRPKLKKYIIYLQNLPYLQSNGSGSLLQTCIDIVEQ